ncbi:hypothetical protein NDU88_008533, partial [Pleurodeles waltl]
FLAAKEGIGAVKRTSGHQLKDQIEELHKSKNLHLVHISTKKIQRHPVGNCAKMFLDVVCQKIEISVKVEKSAQCLQHAHESKGQNEIIVA